MIFKFPQGFDRLVFGAGKKALHAIQQRSNNPACKASADLLDELFKSDIGVVALLFGETERIFHHAVDDGIDILLRDLSDVRGGCLDHHLRQYGTPASTRYRQRHSGTDRLSKLFPQLLLEARIFPQRNAYQPPLCVGVLKTAAREALLLEIRCKKLGIILRQPLEKARKTFCGYRCCILCTGIGRCVNDACVVLGLLSMPPIEFFVRRIKFDCFVVINNCPFWIMFSMPSQTSKEIRARVAWIQRKHSIKIGNCVVVVAVLAKKQTSFAISGGILGIERNLMAEFDDHSVAIGDSDFLFVLPRWHLPATLFKLALLAARATISRTSNLHVQLNREGDSNRFFRPNKHQEFEFCLRTLR